LRPQSELAGKIFKVESGKFAEQEILIEDWWENISGKSWMVSNGNPACLEYAFRIGLEGKFPPDNEVLYGKIGDIGHLVHISELEKGG